MIAEGLERLGPDRLCAAAGDAPARQIETLQLLVPDALDAERVGEVGGVPDGPSVAREGLEPRRGPLQEEQRRQEHRGDLEDHGRQHEADETHVVIERQPGHADVLVVALQALEHEGVDVRGQVAVRERDALGARRGAAGELEERDVVEGNGRGLERLERLADGLDGDDLLQLRARRLHRAEEPLDLRVGDEGLGAALLDDVPRVVEVALEMPDTQRRIDGDRDDPGPDGAEEAKDEVLVGRQDERHPVALAKAQRLQRAAVPRARALDRSEREGGLARVVRGARQRDSRLGDEAEASGRVALGGILDGLGQRPKFRHRSRDLPLPGLGVHRFSRIDVGRDRDHPGTRAKMRGEVAIFPGGRLGGRDALG